MGFLDTVLNGLGDDAAGGLGDLLKTQGGVGGLAEKFGQAGLGDVVGSWIGKGANAGISAEQIAAVLGSGPLADFAQKLGVSPQQASETLAGLLPEAIDRLTPGGQVDGADDLLAKLPGGVGDMIGGFFKR
ncbi:YidB family protein [Brevundimonas sp. UBA7534]|uniref:YidB family protein n=1 Tax=Brevundimonas sp. UBA7534 TaxID=1946138 RepID=UPI0025C2E303|nr:YidB family protein [Brevundimonas sp. UBA7534]